MVLLCFPLGWAAFLLSSVSIHPGPEGMRAARTRLYAWSALAGLGSLASAMASLYLATRKEQKVTSVFAMVVSLYLIWIPLSLVTSS